MESHAGTTPMERRKDALAAASMMVTEANRLGETTADARTTIGMMEVSPNSRNVIPGHVFFSMDLRHPDAEILGRLGKDFEALCARIAKEHGCTIEFEEIWYSPPVKFDNDCIGAVQDAADSLSFDNQPITSGAGHDAVYVSKVAPTAMIFIPCKDGISHNEIEEATQEHLTAGCDVLLNAIVARANLVR